MIFLIFFTLYLLAIIKNEKPTCSTRAELNSTTQKCSICEFEFPDTLTDDNINQHMETCLISSGPVAENMSIEPKQLACPFCSQQRSFTGHLSYLDHLTKCCNDIPDTDWWQICIHKAVTPMDFIIIFFFFIGFVCIF